MKTTLFLLLAFFFSVQSFEQAYTPYYYQRKTAFQQLPASKGKIIFCGDSITDGAEWSELFNDPAVANRGISGDIAEGVLNRCDEITREQPDKLFLMIGINDLAAGRNIRDILSTIQKIIDTIHTGSPQTNIFLQSLLPVNASLNRFPNHTNKNDSILVLNTGLQKIARAENLVYVDLHSGFLSATKQLDTLYTNDGLHLNGTGYLKWKTMVYPYVYDIAAKPALIPQPLTLSWGNQTILFSKPVSISCDKSFTGQLIVLQKIFSEKNIRTNGPGQTQGIRLTLVKEKMPEGYLSEESYRIHVKDDQIRLSAFTEQGIFYAIQTLAQLLRDGAGIPECDIYDKPAFAWRGIMQDAGRNYLSPAFLKQQIEKMAAYKLNRFHLHLTEDIAWRIESKLYPQLTDAINMQRNAGEYYSIGEIKELVQYCKERFITLIPELDMPGHSAAFKRAMGVDMQSEEGIAICRRLLEEFCTAIDVPYIHIGGDEVKISRKDFLPAMIHDITGLGKKVIAWDPGGNVPAGTILQMWNGNTVSKKNYPSLDSRHLYMNHHDPIDGVVSVFNHKICDTDKGDSLHLGAITCVWPDRRIAKEEDILRMNPFYPEMITLAERCWAGGGEKNYISDIAEPGTKRYTGFTEFEKKLTEHQQLYFRQVPFPYVKQSNIFWKLIGPFENGGNTAAVFKPEQDSQNLPLLSRDAATVYGGTIFLRHFWAPLIGSHIASPKENSTYYAYTSLYSAYEQNIGFWIGFYNISRSNHTPTPDAGKWDNRNSHIWLNGEEIPGPHWQKPGRHPVSMEEPLIDESYEYRSPTVVTLHKGWNRILIKAPVASFKSGDWQSPVKWMFSCMPVCTANGTLYQQPKGLLFDPLEKALIDINTNQ